MLSIGEARGLVQSHLGDSARARHSIFVGFTMRCLAQHRGEDAVLWEIVGLCHDLDYPQTGAEGGRHGLLAAEWLRDVLPADALEAIRAHDHRSGVASETVIADCLKLADALAVVARDLADRAVPLLASPDAGHALVREFADRAYLPKIVLERAKRQGVPLDTLAEICAQAPPPG